MGEILAKTKAVITLIIGGSRSGKSSLAENMAADSGLPVVYLATGEAMDEEMRLRIIRHRESRPKNWRTIEVNKNLDEVITSLKAANLCLIIDCLTIYVAKLMRKPNVDDAAIIKHIQAVMRAAEERYQVIFVSNEVGRGLVPPYPAGRRYRDLLGRANQVVAKAATEVYMMVAGIPVKIKG